MRVLVVDDSAPVRARLIAMLREAHIDVVAEADDGDRALELVRTHAPDVVVLDLQMAGKSGIECLPLLKASTSPPRVIVLTNHADASHRAACARLGADYFFDKSTEFTELVSTVVELAAVS
jgi:DNA-binding NarL/FixJ family response regulator